ncbi:MAG: alkaline phosphatase D family protein [Haliea sp.]|nr:alkaline phosphatase D family protein [Haliea sp.]
MSQRNLLRRRTLLKGMAATSLLPLLGANLIGCSDGSDNGTPDVPGEFLHGVASGDPLADSVILWTRLTPQAEGVVRVAWQVSESADFSALTASGVGTTTADVDYTVKVDVTGLAADRRYYYRFLNGDRTSPVGRTRTLPLGAVTMASFAVVSCSNFPEGYFNVYREVAQQDVAAVLHLGDYLYESGNASKGAELGRVVEPPREILVLADYRMRYAQYRGDVDLQAAHAAHPFITVWDDHEVSNNTWRDGADNHDPATDGDFATRKREAIQAWYEWQPVRPPATVEEIIYRRFQYGDLLDLLMLDTRIVGRDQQLDYADFTSGGMIELESARAAIGAADRTILGDDQRAWLREHLSQSAARWQVLGQQVLLGRYQLPAPLVEVLTSGVADDASIAAAVAAVLAAVAAKGKAPEDRTPEEQALLDSAIPFNLDQWDGYEYERDQLLRHAVDVGSHLVVLAGDTHNAWSSQLTTPEGVIAGVEFGCCSVTSDGFEGSLGEDAATLFAPLAANLIDDLVRANLKNRGYLYLEFTAEEVRASHRFITTVQSRDYALDAGATINHTVPRDTLLLT